MDFEKREIIYCEKYGILESTRKKHLMTVYTSFPNTRTTYKLTIDLIQNKEIERKKLSRYYKKGEVNILMRGN